MTMEHSTFCPCDGNWNICCDNPDNYPEHLICKECSLDDTEYTYEECSCGCLGDWSICENNKENYSRDYNFSTSPPSPHRDDNDWVKSENNPLHQELWCDIPLKGSTKIKKMKVSYLLECVYKYYN